MMIVVVIIQSRSVASSIENALLWMAWKVILEVLASLFSPLVKGEIFHRRLRLHVREKSLKIYLAFYNLTIDIHKLPPVLLMTGIGSHTSITGLVL